MSTQRNSSNINKTFIIGRQNSSSACTSVYADIIEPCSGDTININGNISTSGITSSSLLTPIISGTSISGGSFYGDGSNLTGLSGAVSGSFVSITGDRMTGDLYAPGVSATTFSGNNITADNDFTLQADGDIIIDTTDGSVTLDAQNSGKLVLDNDSYIEGGEIRFGTDDSEFYIEYRGGSQNRASIRTDSINTSHDYFLPNKSGYFALLSDLTGLTGDYVYTSGDTMTGDLIVSADTSVNRLKSNYPEILLIGNNAGENNNWTADTNTYNIFIGDNVGRYYETESDNSGGGSVAIGTNAYLSAGTITSASTTIGRNVVIGYEAGQVAGNGGVMIGYRAGQENYGFRNTFIGQAAGRYCEGNWNNFIGYNAGRNTVGDGNVGVGDSTLYSTVGWRNFALGPAAGRNLQGWNNNVIGFFGGNSANCSGTTMFGEEVGYNNTGSYCFLVGRQVGYNNTEDYRLMIDKDSTDNPLLDGSFSARTLTINGDTSVNRLKSNYDTILIGEGSGIDSTQWSGDNTPNIFIGNDAARYYAANNPQGVQGGNVIMGHNAFISGGTNTTEFLACTRNTIIGYEAGKIATLDNTFIGFQSGFENYGQKNTAIGENTLKFSSGASNSVMVGFGTGFKSIGTDNVGLGRTTFAFNEGDYNIGIGKDAGYNNTGSYSILLGNQVGYNNSTDHRLMIDSSNTDNPLLDGSFSARTLDINGDLTVTGDTTVQSLACSNTRNLKVDSTGKLVASDDKVQTTGITSAATATVDTFADTDADACVWDYVIKSDSGIRAGTVTGVWSASTDTTEYYEISTNDIGNTEGVILSVDIDSDNVRLRATVTGGTWTIKTNKTQL
jgi:hypothetical protein